MRIPSGSTDRKIFFVALDSAGARKTGLSSFTVYRVRDTGSAAAMTTPTVAELDATNMPGVYSLLLDEDTTIGASHDTEEMALHISATGMLDVTRTVELYRPKATEGQTITASGGKADAQVKGMDAGVLTAAAVAADAITSSAIATDAVGASQLSSGAVAKIEAALLNEGDGQALIAAIVAAIDAADIDASLIAQLTRDAILDRVLSGNHDTAGTVGKLLQDTAADTAELQTNQGDWVTISAAGVRGAVGLASANLDTQLGTIAGYIDTEVAAVLADVAAILADTGTTLDGKIDAVKAVTDNLPDSGALTALQSAVAAILADTGTSGVVLAAATLNAIADAYLDRADAIETGVTPRQAHRAGLSAAVAKLAGAATNTVTVRDVNDTKDRITATVDAYGNRTAVSLNLD